MRVTIEDRNHDGRGRAKDGARTVLVAQAHPGEEVVVQVDRRTRGSLQGRVARLLRRDPERIAHGCAHEFRCTGCAFLAATPAVERTFKEERLAALARRLPLAAPEALEPLRSPTPRFGYRAHAKQVFAREGSRVVLGSYVAGTHEVADNRGCPVLVPALAALMDAVAEAATGLGLEVHGPDGRRGLRYAVGRADPERGATQVLIVSSESGLEGARSLARAVAASHSGVASAAVMLNDDPGNVILRGVPEVVAGAPWLEVAMLGYRHRLPPDAFFQSNPAGAAALFETALELAGRGRRCVEGYAGAGALTLPLAARFDEVVAIEEHEGAARALAGAAARAGAGGVRCLAAGVEEALEDAIAGGADAVVLDPPRAGPGPAVAAKLARAPAWRIVLLSCDPWRLEGDAAILAAGGYRIERLVPFDLFPRTPHVETVALFARSAGR